MSLSTSEIGLVLLIVAAFFLPFQFLVTPRVFMRIHLLLAFVCPWTPILVEIISDRTGLWIAVAFVLFLQHACMSTGFVAINILINNTVPPDSFWICKWFFNDLFVSWKNYRTNCHWSLTNIKDVSLNTDPIGFPCNHYFSFFVLSPLFTSNGIFASTLSPALNKKRVIQLESEPEQDCSTIHSKTDTED
ncbi:uncharacterized protein LOC130629677 isoform X2 [Hydractinia symbiolongicarpus]|nr:uncharacterized protein LOC130629677 isoform X2 [Hydractinia symbiolongicarpus]